MSATANPSTAPTPLKSLQTSDRGRLVSFNLHHNQGGAYVEISTSARGRRQRIYVSSAALSDYVANLLALEKLALKHEAENPQPKPTRLW